MRSTKSLLMSSLLALALGVTPALAQQSDHVVDRSELNADVAERADIEQRDREAVLRVLRRPEVRDVAEDAGVDMATAEDAVATLDGPELQRLADRARDVEKALAGGHSSVTISVTAIIIALLVLIIVLVA